MLLLFSTSWCGVTLRALKASEQGISFVKQFCDQLETEYLKDQVRTGGYRAIVLYISYADIIIWLITLELSAVNRPLELCWRRAAPGSVAFLVVNDHFYF